jgi:hypothetical protein
MVGWQVRPSYIRELQWAAAEDEGKSILDFKHSFLGVRM